MEPEPFAWREYPADYLWRHNEPSETWDDQVGEPPIRPRIVGVDRLRETLDLDPMVIDDATLLEVVDAVEGALLPRLIPDVDHALHASCREAALGMCVQVWQSRFAPGGQMMGGDMPYASPHLLGPGLLSRFGGLLAPCLRFGGAVFG